MRIVLLLLFTFILSCTKKGSVPDWVYNFKPEEGRVCGIGTAGLHMKGFSYQRATAIARAIDEIARQKGVTVKTQLEHFLGGTSGGGQVSALSVYSVQTTEGELIRARIVHAYYDRTSQMFYVLMCEEK